MFGSSSYRSGQDYVDRHVECWRVNSALPLSGGSVIPPCVVAGNRWDFVAPRNHTNDIIISLCRGRKPVGLEPSIGVTALCVLFGGYLVELLRNLMAHAQKPHFVFRLNGRNHLNRRGSQFSRLLAAEVCASALVMLDTPGFEVVWEYWLPTPFASFPFTSPPVRHRVPPHSDRSIPIFRRTVLPFYTEHGGSIPSRNVGSHIPHYHVITSQYGTLTSRKPHYLL